MAVGYSNDTMLLGITVIFILFSVYERKEFSKSCNLIAFGNGPFLFLQRFPLTWGESFAASFKSRLLFVNEQTQ